MKKIIICAMILIASAHSFGQQATAIIPVLTKTGYLQKSKHQKIAAWLMLGGGFVLTVMGIIAFDKELKSATDPITRIVPQGAGGPGIALSGIGILSMSGSIPFFVASAKNKRKASEATVSFKMEKAPIIQYSSFVQTSFPALSLRIDLK